MTSVRISLSSGALKLILSLALVAGMGLMIATPPALAQISGQYAPSTERLVADIDGLDIDEDVDEGSTGPTSSGRVPVVGTASPEGNPKASPASSGRAPLTASTSEAGKAEAAGKAKSGRSSVQGVLPATGGPLLPILLLAGLALVGTGMLVVRRFSGR